jgi:zinc protease
MSAPPAGLNPSRTVLDNGVVVTSRVTRKTPAVTINLAIRAGSVIDPPAQAGAMYVLSRVIDRGTSARSAADIAETLDSRGISLNLFVNRHQLTLACTCLSDDFDPVLALIGEIVTSPTVPDTELATRKGEVITGLRQDEDNPAVRAVESLMTLLYGEQHPYGRRLKGTVESVTAMTREQLLALHRSAFGPGALSLVVVGDVDRGRVEASAARVLGGWNAVPTPAVAVQPVVPPEGRRLVVIPMMNKAQTDIAYGFTSITRHDPSYYAFWVMNNVLGQYALGGRLGDSIRERQGMAYYCSSMFEPSVIPGPMMVRAGVSAANVQRAVASIDEELNAIRRDGVTPKELAESRQYLIGSMPRALETNAGIAQFLQNAEFFGLGLDYDRRLPALLGTVTLDDVRQAASLLDPDRATIVVAGPYDQA